MEQKLRKASFGYRAKYIATCTEQIREKGELTWWSKLQTMPYNDTHKALLSLSGIGPKVSDCICLMSLGYLGKKDNKIKGLSLKYITLIAIKKITDAIPVDTHVFQIAKMYYLPNLKLSKTVTPKVYEEIGNTFRNIYGQYAGKIFFLNI